MKLLLTVASIQLGMFKHGLPLCDLCDQVGYDVAVQIARGHNVMSECSSNLLLEHFQGKSRLTLSTTTHPLYTWREDVHMGYRSQHLHSFSPVFAFPRLSEAATGTEQPHRGRLDCTPYGNPLAWRPLSTE